METQALPQNSMKGIEEILSDASDHVGDAVMQQQNRLESNNVARHDYNQAIGGRTPKIEGMVDTALSAPSPRKAQGHGSSRLRRQFRHGLNEKRRAMIPMRITVLWAKFMQSEIKNNIVAVVGEFIGTTMFLFFAFAGTQVANVEAGDTSSQTTTGSATGFNPATLLYISLCFGFSLMVNAWVFFRISGGLFNPAVTLALALLGALGLVRAFLLFIAQISGACFAAYLVNVMFPTLLNVQTTLGSETSIAQGVWIEAVCTAMLVFTIVMLAVEKHRATFVAPVGIGLALFIGELVSVYYTGGSLNPARSFGPAAILHHFDRNHWIYWVGPSIGTILSVLAYWLFKALEYEMANPGQDGDVENDPTQNPEHKIAQIVKQRQAEVEEIKVIEEEGGFPAQNNKSAEGTVLGSEGVIGMVIDGVRDGDKVHVQRVRASEPDLEANWPATQGVEAVQLEKRPGGSPKVA